MARRVLATVIVGAALAGGLAAVAWRRTHPPALAAPNPLGVGPGTGDVERDLRIATFIASLPTHQARHLAGELSRYREAKAVALPRPRTLLGPGDAPVRVTYWIDATGSKSATLLADLERLRASDTNALALEQRQFPRESCFPASGDPERWSVSCLAASALICLEGKSAFSAIATQLVARPPSLNAPGMAARQSTGVSPLSPAKILTTVGDAMGRDALQRCLTDPATAEKLRADVDLARTLEDAPPVVVVNGRRSAASGTLIRALVLTRGVATHPAFKALPLP